MITVTGAVFVFSTLPGATAGSSRALASGVVMKTNRAGEEFALVGPNAARLYASFSNSIGTGSGRHTQCVRASRNIWSKDSELIFLCPCTACCDSAIVSSP